MLSGLHALRTAHAFQYLGCVTSLAQHFECLARYSVSAPIPRTESFMMTCIRTELWRPTSTYHVGNFDEIAFTAFCTNEPQSCAAPPVSSKPPIWLARALTSTLAFRLAPT